MENFGDEELSRLQDSTAAIVGLGATGSVIAEHLARHGINLILVDRDYLEEKDLYTSNIYGKEQVENGIPKAKAAEQKLSRLTDVEAYVEHLGGENTGILDGADIILDGTDNLATRFLINEYSKQKQVPWIYTAAIGEKSYSMLFDRECFNCIFDEVPAGSLETCETAGIMREASAIAGSRTAWKAVRYLAGKEVDEKFEMFPGEKLEVESSGCGVCEDSEFDRLDHTSKTISVCGENKYQVHRDVGDAAFERLEEIGEILADNSYLTRSIVNGKEFTLFQSGRAIIEAQDQNEAEARFDEILGR